MIAVICVHLCLSVVNNDIEIIPAYFLFAHALSVGLESGVCERRPRLLEIAAGGAWL